MIPQRAGNNIHMASHPTSRSVDAVPSVAHTPIPVAISSHEAALLRRILSGGSFQGGPQLLEQVHTLYLAPAVSDSNFRIYIQHPETPRAPYSLEGRSKLPLNAVVRRPEGDVVAHIDVWVERGHLRAMHLRWASERIPMTLPDPEWVEVGPDAEPPAVAEPTPAAALEPRPATAPGAGGRTLSVALAALCAIALFVGAFVYGRSGGSDVAAARRAGQQAGERQGTADGGMIGAFQGSTEGEIAGRQSTYQPAFDAASARVKARQAAVAKAKRERAAAAALAAATAAPYRVPNNTNCSGYRDARGYWICR